MRRLTERARLVLTPAVRSQLRRDLRTCGQVTLALWLLVVTLTGLVGSVAAVVTGSWAVPLFVAGVATLSAAGGLVVATLALTGIALSLNWPRTDREVETDRD